MTRASSAAEPSMEEILASIRRIISDEEEGNEREAASAMNQVAPTDAQAASQESTESVGAGTASVGSAAEPASTIEARHLDAAEEEVFGLTDKMLDEVPTEEPGGASHSRWAPEPDCAAKADAAKGGADPAPDCTTPIGPKGPDMVIADAASLPRNRPEAWSAGEGDVQEGAHEAGTGPAKETSAPQPNDQATAPAGDDHLLSPAADAQVTAAFNQLASTILMKDARTLDDLVQDMLRPMLKEWLDDNLPQLVERLVREEIQRVSRGRG